MSDVGNEKKQPVLKAALLTRNSFPFIYAKRPDVWDILILIRRRINT